MKGITYSLLAAISVGGLSSAASAAVVVVDGFDGDEGRFTANPNTGSGTSVGFVKDATTTATYTELTSHTGPGSQEIIINDDPAVDSPGGEWRLRHLSGGGSPANNLSFASDGFVGYWLKTSTPDLSASIQIDDGAALERAAYRPITGDNQWHLYQWDLNDAADWEAFAGTGTNGAIDAANVSIDSVYLLRLAGDAGADYDAVMYLDDVSINPAGPIPEPTSLALFGVAGAALLGRRRRA